MPSPQDVIRSYFERFEAADAEGVARLFALDASILPNGMDTVTGRPAIEETFTRIVSMAEMSCQQLLFNWVQDLGDVVVVETATKERIRLRSAEESNVADFRELFCLTRSGDSWLIAAYVGNRAKTPIA